jgi:uncharacterized protein YraI
MPISTKVLASGLAGVALLLSAGAAFAEPGQATASVNVRSGPGVRYSIVDQLYPGENVDIGQCDGGWCYVDHAGPDGWVSANYLAADEGYYSPPPVYYEQEPEYAPAPIFIGPPDFHNWQRRHFDHRPPPPGNPPPPPGKPSYHFWQGSSPPAVPQGGTPPRFRFHPGGSFPGGVYRPHVNNPGGGNSCATNPSLPFCTGGSHPGRQH